jgi:endonuclease-3
MDSKKAIQQLKILSRNQKEMRLAAESWNSDFEILISIIMSARTRDETTIPVAEKLFKSYHSAKKLSQAKQSEIEKIIRPVNFFRNKTKNIIACAKKIDEEFHGKIPREIEPLISLPGVGRKTANVFLTELGFSGIGVDTHVSYCSQKLEWTKNKNPWKIEQDLKQLFPKKYWNKVNSTLVRFGKTHTSRKEKDKKLEEIRRVK